MEHFDAAMVSVSDPLIAVMEAENAQMAVMRLDVSFVTYIPTFQYSNVLAY